jgi:DNA-binding LytR/AlgR family response regulator
MPKKQFLFRPHPFNFSIKRVATHSLIAFLSVFFILFIVRPFELDKTNMSNALVIAFSFACVCPLVILPLEISLCRFFSSYYSEKNWTVLKTLFHFVLVIIFMSIGNHFMSIVLFENSFSLIGIVNFLYPTFAVGIIPITISVFYSQYIHYKKYTLKANQLNKELQEKLHTYQNSFNDSAVIKPEANFSKEKIQAGSQNIGLHPSKNIYLETPLLFQGQNKAESFEVLPKHLIYCSAADNYVDFYILENNKIKRKTQRNTLSNVSDQLAPFPFFVKCHRSYLVNVSMVENVLGNAQGLRLQLKYTDQEIPVSRTMSKEISSLLLQNA